MATLKDCIEAIQNGAFIKVTFYNKKTPKEVCTEYKCIRISEVTFNKLIEYFNGRLNFSADFSSITKHYYKLKK